MCFIVVVSTFLSCISHIYSTFQGVVTGVKNLCLNTVFYPNYCNKFVTLRRHNAWQDVCKHCER
jgi:hypothetical protein